MSIPIEGLVSREPIQKNERHPDQGIPLLDNGNIPDNPSQDGIFPRVRTTGRRGNRFQSYLLAGLTLASPLLAACGESTARAGTNPSAPEATATAFTQDNPDVVPQVNIPGVGRVGVSTPEPATATNPPQESATPGAANSEVEQKVKFGMLASPESYTRIDRLQSIDQDGNVFEVIGIVAKPGASFTLPYKVQAAKSEIKQPSKYKGNRVTAKSMDGKVTHQISGAIRLLNPNQKTENIDPGNPITEVDNTGIKVFDGFDYNVAIQINDLEIRRQMLPGIDNMQSITVPFPKNIGEQAIQPPKQFFDIPAPKIG